jgi:hypothetical protein
MPYGIPEIVSGIEREASTALIAEWIRRSPDRAWAIPYIPEGASPRGAPPNFTSSL